MVFYSCPSSISSGPRHMRNDIITPNTESFLSAKNNTRIYERERERERGICAFHNYDNIISVENLLIFWQEFLKGKRKRRDVILFSMNLMDNIYFLHNDLKNKIYKHSNYEAFKINDPRPRNIHKASVRDRLLHHAIYRILYPYF